MRSHKKTARIAGFLYLGVAVCSGFAAVVRSSLIAPGDAAATASNIIAGQLLFRSGIVCDLTGQAFHILLALSLYELFNSVSKTGALILVVLALIPVPIACINTLNQIAVLPLLISADYLKVFDPHQLQAQAMLYLDLHNNGVLIAQVFWGLWLLPLGYMVLKSAYVPGVLGALLIVAGLGYLVDSLGGFLSATHDFNIAVFTFWGEVFFLLWLLIKGVHNDNPDPVEDC